MSTTEARSVGTHHPSGRRTFARCRARRGVGLHGQHERRVRDFVFVSLKHRLRGTWGVDKRTIPLDVAQHVPTEPDLLFTGQSGTNVLVADSKYKLISDGRGRNADYYQLLAYCTSLGLPRGVLIYCDAADAQRPPRAIEVRQSGTVLETFQVSLSGSIDDIAREFDRLSRHLRFGK